jgi:hypothetical protein
MDAGPRAIVAGMVRDALRVFRVALAGHIAWAITGDRVPDPR